MSKIVARWQDWTGTGLEHLVLREEPHQVVAEAAILGSVDDNAFAAHYHIRCDTSWRVKKVEIAEIGSDRTTQLTSDGIGSWVDRSGAAMPQLRGSTKKRRDDQC